VPRAHARGHTPTPRENSVHETGDEKIACLYMHVDGPAGGYQACCSASSTASGCLAMTASRIRAGPSGRVRPCSHSALKPVRSRIAPLLHLVAEPGCRFADNGQPMSDHKADCLIGEEFGFRTATDRPGNRVQSFEHVTKALLCHAA